MIIDIVLDAQHSHDYWSVSQDIKTNNKLFENLGKVIDQHSLTCLQDVNKCMDRKIVDDDQSSFDKRSIDRDTQSNSITFERIETSAFYGFEIFD